MSKLLLGIVLGLVLGAFDGLTAYFSPEKDQLSAIVMGSSIKGLIVGLLTGFYASRVDSLKKGVIFGLVAGLFFAFLTAYMQYAMEQKHYWMQIMVPGTIVGAIIGYATQKYGRRKMEAA